MRELRVFLCSFSDKAECGVYEEFWGFEELRAFLGYAASPVEWCREHLDACFEDFGETHVNAICARHLFPFFCVCACDEECMWRP